MYTTNSRFNDWQLAGEAYFPCMSCGGLRPKTSEPCPHCGQNSGWARCGGVTLGAEESTEQAVEQAGPPPEVVANIEAARAITRLENEIDLHQQLDGLHIDLYQVMKRATNFIMRTYGPAYRRWKELETTIDETDLTPDARLRLKYRHAWFKKYVSPKPFSLIQALLPILVFLAVKGFISGKMHERKIEALLRKKRDKRRKEQQEEKARRRKEKGLE